MNTKMLSVERELLSSICDDFEAGQHSKACEGASKLRAILDDKYRAPPINIHCHANNVQIIRNEDGSYTLRNKVDQEQNPKITGRVYSFSADETAPAAQHQGEPVAWRGMNADGEVVTEWIDGVPPERMTDLSGNAASFDKIERAYAEKPAPVAVVMPERDALRDLIAEAIGGDTYDCTRVWTAWGVGTMSEDDFVSVVEQEDRLYEIADSLLAEVARLNGVNQ